MLYTISVKVLEKVMKKKWQKRKDLNIHLRLLMQFILQKFLLFQAIESYSFDYFDFC